MKVILNTAWLSGRAGPAYYLQQTIERDWPELPLKGDYITVEDASRNEQLVMVTGRLFDTDGSVQIWVGDFDAWSIDDVEALGFEVYMTGFGGRLRSPTLAMWAPATSRGATPRKAAD